ncbi:hypothetical protein ACFQY5_00625 [Paeniroseomonas aquatica]|uniref:hypothetical protein n=1 Tax=Paeniroseomonas aquatica TaxID=373043 RepID=UPI0036089301
MADDRAGPNAAQAAYWNGPSTRAWATHHARIDARFAPVLARALDRAAPRPGARVLDIGCGSGTSTLALAERVGPQGRCSASTSPRTRSRWRSGGSPRRASPRPG